MREIQRGYLIGRKSTKKMVKYLNKTKKTLKKW